MAAVKSAHRFMDRQGAAVIGLFAGGTVLFAVVVYFVHDVLWQKVAGVIWFVGIVASLVTTLSRMGRAFKCPDCGGPVGPLLETDGKVGTPLLRRCPKCDVLWKVGVEPDS